MAACTSSSSSSIADRAAPVRLRARALLLGVRRGRRAVSLGGLFSAFEGYHKIADPHEIDSPAVAIGILTLAFVFEAFAIRHATPQRGKKTWTRYIGESRSPELPVLLLEDSGALFGLLFALIGVILALVTGNPVFDGIGNLAIGVLLLAIAVVLAIEMRSLLIGESATLELQGQIEAELERAPHVRRVIHTLTQHLGPEELLVAAKVEFDPDLTTAQLVEAINDCEQRLRALTGVSGARIYIEPDIGARESIAEAAQASPNRPGS